MRLIPLTRGLFTMVDDEDFEELNKFKWHAVRQLNTWYAERRIIIDGKTKSMKMHRYLVRDNPLKLEIDHIDGNGLNNQKLNIRACTHSQNMMNQKLKSGCSSRYKGVHWCKRDNVWILQIRTTEKYFTKPFKNEVEAARQYDIWAVKFFGEYARLNFPLL